MESLAQAAVLGAGTMGSRIAALFAAAGVPVLLLDLTDELAAAGASRAQAGPLVTPASFNAGIPRLGDPDWVLEAVSEDLATKRDLWRRVSPLLKSDAIASTNTSGLSLASISEALPPAFRRRFMGVHFFNPPAKLRLVELIRGLDTLPAAADRASDFVTQRLDKIVVEARDTPNFIANRIGAFFSATAQHLTAIGNYTVEEVDFLTGPLIGLPRTGTYRLMDVIGLDIWAQVLRTLEPTDVLFRPQPFLTVMLQRGFLGEKTQQGFYRKRVVEGHASLEALDLLTMKYREATTHPLSPTLPKLPERLRFLLARHDRQAQFLRPLLNDLFAYCHRVAPEIAHSPADIDLAMQHGYGWQLGPFAMQAALESPGAS